MEAVAEDDGTIRRAPVGRGRLGLVGEYGFNQTTLLVVVMEGTQHYVAAFPILVQVTPEGYVRS